jgi:transposase, IS5 family
VRASALPGRSGLPIRLMVGMICLKHAYNESDDSVCERWTQDVSHTDFLWAYFQFFCGEDHFQPHLKVRTTRRTGGSEVRV